MIKHKSNNNKNIFNKNHFSKIEKLKIYQYYNNHQIQIYLSTDLED